jgi:hypothetical protein|tara:strand:- start:1135 stop:1260 length:126 start_codon:yes stop_codon:yes gene_type:complete
MRLPDVVQKLDEKQHVYHLLCLMADAVYMVGKALAPEPRKV